MSEQQESESALVYFIRLLEAVTNATARGKSYTEVLRGDILLTHFIAGLWRSLHEQVSPFLLVVSSLMVQIGITPSVSEQHHELSVGAA